MTSPWQGGGRDPWLPQRLNAMLDVQQVEASIRHSIWTELSAWLVKLARRVLRDGAPPDLDGKSPLNSAGKPQKLRYSTPTNIVIALDPATGKKSSAEIKSGTLGPDVLDIATLTKDHGVFTFLTDYGTDGLEVNSKQTRESNLDARARHFGHLHVDGAALREKR